VRLEGECMGNPSTPATACRPVDPAVALQKEELRQAEAFSPQIEGSR
jgi:hypothetical protein